MSGLSNQDYAILGIVEEQSGLKGQDACDSLVGKVVQLDQPNFDAGETWDDIPYERILRAYIGPEEEIDFSTYAPSGRGHYVKIDTEIVEK